MAIAMGVWVCVSVQRVRHVIWDEQFEIVLAVASRFLNLGETVENSLLGRFDHTVLPTHTQYD